VTAYFSDIGNQTDTFDEYCVGFERVSDTGQVLGTNFLLCANEIKDELFQVNKK
jgi:hypothetical protein